MKVKDFISQLESMGIDEETELRFGYLKTNDNSLIPVYCEFKLKQIYDERQIDMSPNMVSLDFEENSIA